MSGAEGGNKNDTDAITIIDLLKQLRKSGHESLAQALEEAHINALNALARDTTPLVQTLTDTTIGNGGEEIPKEDLNNLKYRKKVFDLLSHAILNEPGSGIEFFVHGWAKPVRLTGTSDFLVFSGKSDPESYNTLDGDEWANFFKNRNVGNNLYYDAHKWGGLDRYARDYGELKNWFGVARRFTDIDGSETSDWKDMENIALGFAFDIGSIQNEKYRKYQDSRGGMLFYGVRIKKSLMNKSRPYEGNGKNQQDVLAAINKGFDGLGHEFCLYFLQKINPEFIDFMSLSLRMRDLREKFPLLKM